MSTPTTTELLDAIGVLYSYILTSINTNHPKSLVGNSLHDFADGNGRIPAYQHINPNGSIGGWVAVTAYVAPTCHIAKDATVFGYARVEDYARIEGSARVHEFARVYGHAEIRSDS